MKKNVICKVTKGKTLKLAFLDSESPTGAGVRVLDLVMLKRAGVGWETLRIQFNDFDAYSQQEIKRIFENEIRKI